MSQKNTNGQKVVQAVLQGESDNAVYWTCMCLHKQHHLGLEDAWIELSARIGAKTTMPFRSTWMYINRCLLQLVQGDQWHVSDAIQMTGMLFVLQHRQLSADPVKCNFAGLRKEILDLFPNGALLSYRGQQQFARILSPVGSAAHDFKHRVLAGMGRLVESQDSANLHRALEYISRKKMQIPLPNVWPAPTTELADKGDPVWFLWGSMLLSFPGNEDLNCLWELYKHQWRPGGKGTRAGLLWGVAHLLNEGVSDIWSPEEAKVLDKAGKIAPKLWASFGQGNIDPEHDEDDSHATTTTDSSYQERSGQYDVCDYSMFDTFLPRKQKAAALLDSFPQEHLVEAQQRVLHIKSGNTPHVPNISPQKQQPNVVTPSKHEKHDKINDPLYRWMNVGP